MQKSLSIHVAPNGRMVLPRDAREALGVKGAGVIVLSFGDDGVRLTSMADSLAHAQALFRSHVAEPFTSDDFLAERRREAAAENEGE